MNFVNFMFSFVLLMLALSQNTRSSRVTSSSRDPKEDHISRTFAQLLQSLVRVNEERVNALNKFFKLNDFQLAKKMLRDGERSKEPVVLVVVNDENVPEIEGLSSVDRTLPDSDSDSDTEGLTIVRDGFDDPLRIRRIKQKPDSDSSNEVVSSERKRPFNKTDTLLMSDSDSYEEKGFKKRPRGSQRVLGDCIAAAMSRVRCTNACKSAYRNACDYTDRCSGTLYRRLRKECKNECRSRFDK